MSPINPLGFSHLERPVFDEKKIRRFAGHIVSLSAKEDTITAPQGKILQDYRAAIRSIINRNQATERSSTAKRKNKKRLEGLDASFARISDPQRLTREYELALTDALENPMINLNGLNSGELSKILGDDIGHTMLGNIKRMFKKDSAEILEKHILKPTSDSGQNLAQPDVEQPSSSNAISADDEKKQRMVFAFENETRASEELLQRLEPALKVKMRETIAKVIKENLDDDDFMPFKIATPLALKTEMPPVPAIGSTIELIKLSNTSTRSDKEHNAKILRAKGRAIYLAGKYSVLEGVLTSSEVAKVCASTALTGGVARLYQNPEKIHFNEFNPVYAGALSGIIGSSIVVARDTNAGRVLMSNQLNGVNLHRDLRDPYSPYYNARKNLSRTVGQRWVSDFEKWARISDSLSLESVTNIAKDLRAQLNHAPALESEFEEYRDERNIVSDVNASAKQKTEDSARRLRGRRGTQRYDNEKNLLNSIAQNLEIATRASDFVGIRCLARFEDGKATDDVKKLYEICRREIHLDSPEAIETASYAFIRQKYPISTAFVSWEPTVEAAGWFNRLLGRRHLVNTQQGNP